MNENTTQNGLIIEVVSALYDYRVAVSDATRDNRRPGIKWDHPENIATASCGAFREWSIFAVYDRIAISADGYRVRDNWKHGGQIFVHVGNGEIRFPANDSRSHHSLDLSIDGGEGKLVNVTREDGPWTARLPEMARKLRNATQSVRRAIEEFDDAERAKSESERQSELSAAVAVFR